MTPKAGVAVEHTGHVLLNVHGGSFMYGSRINSRLEAVPIAALGKIKVISVDYRMAPEHIGLYGASAGPGPDPVSGGGTAIACSPQRL